MSKSTSETPNERPECSAHEVEKTYVHDVYERIADHFDCTRHSQWTGVKKFLSSLPRHSWLLDVGCGNGKYLNDDGLVKIGCDRSLNLLDICAKKCYFVFAANCLQLPVQPSRFDAVISIAVIHHLTTEERRRRAVLEILSVLKVGGKALIYVWAFEQKRNGVSSNYLKNDSEQKDDSSAIRPDAQTMVYPVHENRTPFASQDLLVPWEKRPTKQDREENRFLRFYHVFRQDELENLCKTIDSCRLVESFYEQGNWCVVVERTH